MTVTFDVLCLTSDDVTWTTPVLVLTIAVVVVFFTPGADDVCSKFVRTMKPKHCTRATVIATFLLLVILFLELLSLLRLLMVVGCYSRSILSMLTITLSRLLLYMGRQDDRRITNI